MRNIAPDKLLDSYYAEPAIAELARGTLWPSLVGCFAFNCCYFISLVINIALK